jgi:hypothetical protein
MVLDNGQKSNKFPKELRGHDLLELATRAKFDFSSDEIDPLRQLTRHAI